MLVAAKGGATGGALAVLTVNVAEGGPQQRPLLLHVIPWQLGVVVFAVTAVFASVGAVMAPGRPRPPVAVPPSVEEEARRQGPQSPGEAVGARVKEIGRGP